jgi:uncharacterized integral membrane protein
MILFLIFSLLLSITAALFALKNTLPVTVTFLSYTFTGSLAVVLMTAFGLGLLVAVCALLPALLSAKWKNRSLVRRIQLLERPQEAAPAEKFETVPPQAPPPMV